MKEKAKPHIITYTLYSNKKVIYGINLVDLKSGDIINNFEFSKFKEFKDKVNELKQRYGGMSW